MRKIVVPVIAAAVAIVTLATAAQAQEPALISEPTADDVRAAFAGLPASQFEAVGYALLEPVCVDASVLPPPVLQQLGIPATAAMGIHYANFAMVDDTLDAMEPEVAVFGPDGTLWSVEYLSPTAGEMLGQTLSFVEEIELYALHLWVIDNPAGQFADFNPAVTCATPSTDEVKATFAGLTQSEIEAMGYALETPCIDASELPPPVLSQLGIPATAGMGIHFINFALVDSALNPFQPEAIQLGPDGTVWNVEYITPPQERKLQLFGQTLSFVPDVDIDGLHLWVVDNPMGQFFDFNPAVSCAAVQAPATGSAGLASADGGAGAVAWLAALGALVAAVGGARLLVGRRASA
jgi:hypothetical protein